MENKELLQRQHHAINFGKLREELSAHGIQPSFWHVSKIMEAIGRGEKRVEVQEVRKNVTSEGVKSLDDLMSLHSHETTFVYEIADSTIVSLDTERGSMGIRDIDDEQITHCSPSVDDSSKIGSIFIASVHGDRIHTGTIYKDTII